MYINPYNAAAGCMYTVRAHVVLLVNKYFVCILRDSFDIRTSTMYDELNGEQYTLTYSYHSH
jgi:hypothetical protein